MRDGDIFKVEDSIYLQLGELQGSPEAPYLVFQVAENGVIIPCQKNLRKFFIPNDWIPQLTPNYYYIDLSIDAYTFLDCGIFGDDTYVTTLDTDNIRAIKDCASSLGLPSQKIKKFFSHGR